MMEVFFDLADNFPWFIPAMLAVVLLFGLFLRRKTLAARATRVSEEKNVSAKDWNRARLQFLLTIVCVFLLILIWLLQTYFSSG